MQGVPRYWNRRKRENLRRTPPKQENLRLAVRIVVKTLQNAKHSARRENRRMDKTSKIVERTDFYKISKNVQGKELNVEKKKTARSLVFSKISAKSYSEIVKAKRRTGEATKKIIFHDEGSDSSPTFSIKKIIFSWVRQFATSPLAWFFGIRIFVLLLFQESMLYYVHK